MAKSNPVNIKKLGSVVSTSAPISLPPPKQLLGAGIYQQKAGLHPGQITPSTPIKTWQLEQGKEVVELVVGGRGWVSIEGQGWVKVTPGALLWHIPGDQSIARSDHENPYRCLAVAFETHNNRGIRRTPQLSWWHDLDEAGRFSRELIHWYLDESFSREALLHYAYGRLLFQSQFWVRTQVNADVPLKLKQAVDWIIAHATEEFSLRNVASMIGWSTPHLHEVFKEKLDITPHQFVIERRIKLAKERLVMSDDPIKQIASTCGFSSTAAFCHAFKARVAVTPAQYRDHERSWMMQRPTESREK